MPPDSTTGDLDDCIRAPGTPAKVGYGRFRVNGKVVYAHRYAYEQAHGPIPAGMHIHHRCANKMCVNPQHLELIDPRDHWREGRARKRTGTASLKLTPEDVKAIRSSNEGPVALARRYGVTYDAIYRVRKGINWKEVPVAA